MSKRRDCIVEAKEYYRFLLHRYYNGTATAAEEEELFTALRSNTDEEEWTSLISELHANAAADPAYDPALYEANIDRILHPAMPLKKLRSYRWYYAAAASLLLLIAAGGYLNRQRAPKAPAAPALAIAADVQPGRNGAVLTLGDGSQVVLDSLHNGVISTQQGTKVLLRNGQLSYDASAAGTVSYNTMTTPRGRKFRLQLPDGTNVWLNAASAISFPTAFTGNNRTISLTGEAYFEVAPDKALPFIVKINNETAVEVLGTHFNISSYQDDASISTTLLEGAVRVKAPQQSRVLQPGQQLAINRASGATTFHPLVDTLAVIAWKNGNLNFQDKQLTAVMSMIARWYDIEVVYETTPPNITFVGEIGSDVTLASVLTFLKDSGIHFRLEGRKLIIGA
ncbi:FecR family protein [Chitinophaga sp. 22321]|uniref:FecR domain-containing protein n=1 Tax=Chitinophaga hostae TaxID=2831022 RepID=A0ABS5J7A5_9BACT|nr:FecR family protein [Chitinophaga hostae]MBS0031104.1 FecR domain-containing protein [Chitinophaga hostae]